MKSPKKATTKKNLKPAAKPTGGKGKSSSTKHNAKPEKSRIIDEDDEEDLDMDLDNFETGFDDFDDFDEDDY